MPLGFGVVCYTAAGKQEYGHCCSLLLRTFKGGSKEEKMVPSLFYLRVRLTKARTLHFIQEEK